MPRPPTKKIANLKQEIRELELKVIKQRTMEWLQAEFRSGTNPAELGDRAQEAILEAARIYESLPAARAAVFLQRLHNLAFEEAAAAYGGLGGEATDWNDGGDGGEGGYREGGGFDDASTAEDRGDAFSAERSKRTRKVFECESKCLESVNELLLSRRFCDHPGCINFAAVCDTATFSLLCCVHDEERQMAYESAPSFSRFACVSIVSNIFVVGDSVVTNFGRGEITGIRWSPDRTRVIFYEVCLLRYQGSAAGAGSIRGILSPSCVKAVIADSSTGTPPLKGAGNFSVIRLSPNEFPSSLHGKITITRKHLPEYLSFCEECPVCVSQRRPGPSRFRVHACDPKVEVVMQTLNGPFLYRRALTCMCIENGCDYVRNVDKMDEESNFNFTSLSIHATISKELLTLFAQLHFDGLKYSLPAEAAYKFIKSRCEAARVAIPPEDEFRAALLSFYSVHSHLSTIPLKEISGCFLCPNLSPTTLNGDGNAKTGIYGKNPGSIVPIGGGQTIVEINAVQKISSWWASLVAQRSGATQTISGCSSDVEATSTFSASRLDGNCSNRGITGMFGICCPHQYFYKFLAILKGETHMYHLLGALVLAHLNVAPRSSLVDSAPLFFFSDISCMVIRTVRHHSPIDVTHVAEALWPSTYQSVLLQVLDDNTDGRPVVEFSFTGVDGSSFKAVRVFFIIDALHAKGHQCEKIFVSGNDYKQYRTFRNV